VNLFENTLHLDGVACLLLVCFLCWENDSESDSWTTKKPPLVKVSNYAYAVFDSRIYVMSGSGEGASFAQIYHLETDPWSYVASIPTPVWGRLLA
jgi:hypothetical protein